MLTYDSLCYTGGVLANKICVVPTLLHNDDFRADLHQLLGHVVVGEWAQLRLSERVMDPTVEPARYQDQVRIEFPRQWQQKLVTGVEVLSAAELGDLSIEPDVLVRNLAGFPSHVNIIALTGALADILSGAVGTPREERLVVEPV